MPDLGVYCPFHEGLYLFGACRLWKLLLKLAVYGEGVMPLVVVLGNASISYRQKIKTVLGFAGRKGNTVLIFWRLI